jgi:N-acetylmuramoyl-L-alanine amidase
MKRRTPFHRPGRRGLPRVAGCILAWAVVWAAAGPLTAAVRRPRPLPGASGRPVPLHELERVYRLQIDPHASDLAPVLTGGRRVEFEGGRKLRVDGTRVWMHQPLERVRGRWTLSAGDALHLLDPILRPRLHLAHLGARRVTLDPGHGGSDPGAVAGPLREKDLALAVARRARARIEAYGFEVRMTRERDVFLTLEERPVLAAAWESDLLLSIHINASTERGARGVETYILSRAGEGSTNDRVPRPASRTQTQPGNRYDAANAVLGWHVQRQLAQATGSDDRGLRYARFVVLRDAPCPAALVECGYLSHRDEARSLGDAAYQERIAEGLARGAGHYLNAVLQARLMPP